MGRAGVKGATPTREASSLADLHQDPANRRKRTPRSQAMLVEALHAVGAARSIVIDEHDDILAGNGVVAAAAAAGLTKLQIVEADGQTVIAVRRRGLTPAQKRHLALADNRAAELAEWDVEQLAADLQNGENLAPFFLAQELKTLLHPDGAAPAAVAEGVPQFVILVTCLDEPEQTALLERFITEGLICRAVVS